MSKKYLYGAILLSALSLIACGTRSGSPSEGMGSISQSGSGSGGSGGGGSGGGGGGGSGGSQATITSVNHIIMLMQENRSFDHYFGAALNAYRARQGLSQEIDGIPAGVSLESWDGTPNISPYHMVSMCIEDLSSSWQEAHSDIDLHSPNNPYNPPPMNGFASMAGGFSAHTPGYVDTAGKRALGYYTDSDLPFYYWAATQFATSDRWFSAAPVRTQPNRMYLLAATSQGRAYPPTTVLTAKTIFELLQENGISWKVYVTNNWSPGATGDTYMNYFANFTSKHVDHFADAKTFATDAQNGMLPQVALIESGYESGQDEHPLNSVQTGAAYAESIFTSLLNSPSWKDSVFFVTFDEGGGLYDHQPPMQAVSPDGIPPNDLHPGDPPGDFTITGFRVPLIILSPFAKPHFVSHTSMDFTAMLKFIETRFNLPSLNNRDAAQPTMTEFFDWSAPNLAPGTPPAQPTNGRCYFNSLP
jgi:phospholipase C